MDRPWLPLKDFVERNILIDHSYCQKRLAGLAQDPLLTSMARDNTFLRLLNLWRPSENLKATRFDCRKVRLYVGIEGARTYGVTVVSREEAIPFFRNYAEEVKYFDNYQSFATCQAKQQP